MVIFQRIYCCIGAKNEDKSKIPWMLEYCHWNCCSPNSRPPSCSNSSNNQVLFLINDFFQDWDVLCFFVSFTLKQKKWEIDLENKLLERSSKCTLEDIQGNGPLKWFELKSIAEADKITGLFGISPLIRLWERFRYRNCEDKFQNEGGAISEICV